MSDDRHTSGDTKGAERKRGKLTRASVQQNESPKATTGAARVQVSAEQRAALFRAMVLSLRPDGWTLPGATPAPETPTPARKRRGSTRRKAT